MTRWAIGDLAGRILESYDDVEHVTYTAVQADGSMLCDAVLNRRDYGLKTKEMNTDIVEANYNQKPIDVTGRLYGEFPIYDRLPFTRDTKRWNYTDTADTGDDWLCSVNWIEAGGDVYILDVAMTEAGMEESEPQVAEMLDDHSINEAVIESNNGGRGFARNIERLLHDFGNKTCVVTTLTQTGNKEARILSSSTWVNKHVHMPQSWKTRWPAFYKQLFKYQKKGRNAHDDAPDVLAAIYEQVTGGNRGAATGKHTLWSGR
jgi:predicted phage terminase large subunit-like protein